ncbi:hypothetical protein [Rubellimicrobium sp. CFH 75288]|uniref:hypothetical protein n=1 Tax=Rubellimicrobium sp. CFH 75288 TaxID=2697034 RepID=UPI00141316A7|nr:hypothetical protein [Rubellimicrobium sp. CFH 75288]NAZ37224.1 hypothetical protein [Rubellimicrobium sp. CFH 75288]
MQDFLELTATGGTGAGLSALLARLPGADDWSPRGRIGHPGPAAISLAELADDAAHRSLLDLQLAREIADCPGADIKVAAAYFMDSVGWAVGTVFGHLYLNGVVPALEPRQLALEPRDVPWTHEGESGTGRAWTLWFLVGDMPLHRGLTGEPDLRTMLAARFCALLQPLVERLHTASHLARPALWRLAGDGLAGGLIEPGRAMGLADRAVAEARALSLLKGSRLFAKERQVVKVVLPADPAAGLPEMRDLWRARGGCCRAYTWGGNDYCSTCVHLPPEEQVRRWRTWLAGQRASSHAPAPVPDHDKEVSACSSP